ncbi:SIMPL domain-containing protein [Halalkalibacter akibai]|nr:SIMPL domain-containing protein [Halalkalibacter akibai]
MNHRQNVQQRKNQTVKVVGESTLMATPDQVQIRMGVITQNVEVTVAQAENAETMTTVISEIQELGVQEDQIQTVVYRIDPEYDYIEGEQVFRGYRVVHLIQVTLSQVGLVGTIVDAAVLRGVNSLTSIDFMVQERQALYLIALQEAVNQAKEKALALVEAIQGTLHPMPIEVKELTNESFPDRYPAVLSAQTTPIQPGQLTFQVSVEAIFSYY